MKIRNKYEGCDPLIKTVLQNDQEVFCEAETAEAMVINDNGVRCHGPVKTWIVDYRSDEHTDNRFYYDRRGIAYRKVVMID